MNASGATSVSAEGARVALLYVALTLMLAYPLTRHPASTVLPMTSDTDLYLWTLEWDVHALTHQPLAIFDANIYYPFRHTLAYSENLIGSALIAAPVLWLTGNPVLALNMVALLSCVLCGVGAYVLARRVGIGPLAATLAGIVFAFAPPRFFRLGQLHLTTVQWVPFCLAFVHAYLDSGRRQDLWWASAFFTAQVLTSAHGAVFSVVAVFGLLAWRAALRDPMIRLAHLRDVVLPALCAVALSAIVFFPYRTVQREMGLRRSLEEATYFSPNLTSFLASPTHLHTFLLSHLTGASIPPDASAFLFPGYLTLALAAAGVWMSVAPSPSRARKEPGRVLDRVAHGLEIAVIASIAVASALALAGGARLRYGGNVVLSARNPWRAWVVCAAVVAFRAALLRRVPLDLRARPRAWVLRFRRWSDINRRNDVVFYALLAFVTLWLSLGPPFGLYRLVFDWPGFSFIRVPSRFTILTVLALAILAAAGFERLTARLAERKRIVAASVAAFVLVVEFFAAPLNAVPYSIDIPAVDCWLAGRPTPFVVAEVPLARPNDVVAWARRQSTYMLHSMAHWQKTIHGYSGMQPALHDALYAQLLNFPDEPVLARLASMGVTYVVVHTELYSPAEWRRVGARLDRCKEWLVLEHAEDAGRVYSLRRPVGSSGDCLQ